MVYTATVMTENAYYPVLLLAASLSSRCSSGRRRLAYVAFFATLALAYLTRSQAVVVAAAAVTAPILLGLFRPGAFRATLWAHGGSTRCSPPAGSSSSRRRRRAAGRCPRSSAPTPSSVRRTTTSVARCTSSSTTSPSSTSTSGSFPSRQRSCSPHGHARSTRPLQVLLAVTLALLAWTALVVGTFASRFADRIQERNMFALAPLFLILLLAWVERGAVRPRVLAALAAAGSALLVLAIPFDRFVTTSAVSDTLMLLPWWAIELHTRITWLEWLAFLGACLFALAFLLVPRRLALVLPLVILAYWLVAARPIWSGPYPYGVKQAGAGALFQGIRGVDRDWIDRAVPAGIRGRRPLDRHERPLHRQPERVLQPPGRPGLLHGCADPGRVGGDPGLRRSQHRRRAAPRRAARATGLRPGRRFGRAERDPGRARSTARNDGLEGQRAARPREDEGHGHLSERHVVGPDGDMDARHCRGRLADRLALGRRATLP